MLYTELIQSLSNIKHKKIQESELPVNIYSYNYLHKGQTSFLPSCIYIGRLSDLPLHNHLLPASFLLIEDCEFHTYDHIAFTNLYVIQDTADLTALFDMIADIFSEEQRYNAALQNIQNTLHAGKGMQVLIDVASDYFENPILVNDTAYKVLGMSFGTSFKNETIEVQKTLGYIHEDNVSDMKAAKVNELVSNSDSVVQISRPNTNEIWLFKGIRVRGILLAFIASVNNNRSFTRYDYKFLDFFSNILALEIERNPFYSENAGVMYNYFLADLLTGKITTPEMLTQRSHYLNWKMHKYFQIVTLVSKKDSFLKGNYQWLGQEIRRLVPDCHWTTFEDSFTIVISRPKANILTAREKELLLQFFENNNIIAGQSDPFTQPQDSPYYYNQAARASSTALLFRKLSGIYSYSDMIPYYISKLLLQDNIVEDFSHPAVTILQQYDNTHGTNFLETLKQYLLLGGDSAATASKMHFHRNTLIYRLNKIRELTGLDINDGEERLRIQLYLKLIDCEKEMS